MDGRLHHESRGTSLIVFAPVEARRASDEIINQIRERLETGELRTGDRLPSERELAETFNVSRNTVREALRGLERSGVLELRKGATGGAFIADQVGSTVVSAFSDLFALGLVSPEHLAEARAVVGGAAARLVCERASDDHIEQLRDCVERASAAARVGDIATRSETNFEFHHLLAEASGNPILVILTEAISEVNRRFAEAAGPPPNRQIVPARERLMGCLLERDAEGAVHEITDQIRSVEKFYKRKLGAGPRLLRADRRTALGDR